MAKRYTAVVNLLDQLKLSPPPPPQGVCSKLQILNKISHLNIRLSIRPLLQCSLYRRITHIYRTFLLILISYTI